MAIGFYFVGVVVLLMITYTFVTVSDIGKKVNSMKRTQEEMERRSLEIYKNTLTLSTTIKGDDLIAQISRKPTIINTSKFERGC
jgi:hypothetical protein